MKEIIIEESKWGRGAGIGSGRLLRNGKMCCLGFVALAHGYTPDDIQGVCTLDELPGVADAIPEMCGENSAETMSELVFTNDADDFDDVGRKAYLTWAAAKVGHAFVFKP